MLASSSTTRTRRRAVPLRVMLRRRSFLTVCRRGSLRIEPRVDVAFPESPLAADANGGNLSGLDQAVDSPQVHLGYLQDLFSREKCLVDHS